MTPSVAVGPFRGTLKHCTQAPFLAPPALAIFNGAGGWTNFRERYGSRRGFMGVSRPLFAPDSSWVLIYVASATDFLAGSGRILRLERDPSGRWVKKAEAIIWVS